MIGWVVLGALTYFLFGQAAYCVADSHDMPKERAVAVGMFWPIYSTTHFLKTFVRSANILIDDILGDIL